MESRQRSALARLLNGLKRQQHDYRPSLEIFPALNIDKLAGDMLLATAGADRGAREEPASDSTAFDDIENRIIERVEAEKNAAHGLLLDELRTYKERLTSLDFEGRFGTIRQAAPAAGASSVPKRRRAGTSCIVCAGICAIWRSNATNFDAAIGSSAPHAGHPEAT